MENLKECPFCGKAVAEVTTVCECEWCGNFDSGECPECYSPADGNCMYLVVCSMKKGGCGASSGWRLQVEEAIAAWNARP